MNALSKKPETREDSDLDLISQNIYNLKYFKSIVSDEDERLEFVKGCAKYFRYKLCPKGSEVFRKGNFPTLVLFIFLPQIINLNVNIILGDGGQNFYIILQGGAYVYIPKTEQEIEIDCIDEDKKKVAEKYSEFITQSLSKKSFGTQISKTTLIRANSEFLNQPKSQRSHLTKAEIARIILSEENTIIQGIDKEDLSIEEKLLLLNDTQRETTPYFIKGTPVYKRVTTLRDGECFGELALIFNQPRLTSVIAKEDLHLLCLKSCDYKEIFQSEIRNTLDKVNFFQKIFKAISQEEITRFCHFLEEKTFKFNDVIYKEGDYCKDIYFVKEGNVQVSSFFIVS